MIVKELITSLLQFDMNKEVVVRYEREVRYSELTSGTEDEIVEINNKEMVFDDGKHIVIAADLAESEE